MPLRIALMPGSCLAVLFLLSPVSAEENPMVGGDFARVADPFLSRHCLACHGAEKKKGGIALHTFKDEQAVLKNRKVWLAVLEVLNKGEMPPPEKDRPKVEESDVFTRTIQDVFARADKIAKRDPGRVTMRRLNRAEYKNTIRDLMGLDFDAGEQLPQDDVGYGFDNIGDVLTMSPLLMDRYLAAAEMIVIRAYPAEVAKSRTPRPDFKRKMEKFTTPRDFFSHFAGQAYRRPATPEEIDRLVKLVEKAEAGGEKRETVMQLGMQAVLCSPTFLFRVELDPRPDSVEAHPIDDYQLASRLSYFLWSSMPDDELFALAEKKALHQNLESQVRRMLKDPRSAALVENFGLQWLQVRNLKSFNPDPKTFPDWDEPLRQAMLKETELFFKAIIDEDRSILNLIDADFTFLNERLARHYGIADTNGNPIYQPKKVKPGLPLRGKEFRRVQLIDGLRGGILTQASVLAVTSNPTRTSPVKRGRWVLEQILGTPPPPPPPNVPELPEGEKAALTGSLRQRMEQHRSNPSCANCHARLDPIGFAFENFNAIGQYRTKDGNFPIDPSGTLPDGPAFKGVGDFKAILKNKKDLFGRCLTEKMLTYATGRGLEYYDKSAIEGVVAVLDKQDYRFSTLAIEIARSDPFRLRRGKDQK